MKYTLGSLFTLLAICIFFAGLLFIVSASTDIMSVEANIMASGPDGGGKIIRVEVPDYLFLGNISEGEISQEFKVYINNTGNVDIKVTPQLVNEDNEIFSYLYFRKYKTSNGTAVPYSRIGSFSFNITKPSTGSTHNDEYFYIVLDLRNYTGVISQDIIGHKANVKFFAVEK